jgi:hypothetical protein
MDKSTCGEIYDQKLEKQNFGVSLSNIPIYFAYYLDNAVKI